MNMNPADRQALSLTVAAALLSLCAAAQAQPDTQPPQGMPAAPDAPAPPSPAAPATDARDALKKQAGDVDQATLLKDTLTKTDRQYSLLRAGRTAVNYNLNYAYIGSEAFQTGYTDSTLSLFKIENTRSHTITNSFSLDYGLMDNVTLSGTLPLVSKFTQGTEYSGITNGIGDMTLGARYQPFVQSNSGPTFTLTSQLNVPTGRSPFKTIQGASLSTGSGYASATLGVNASQVLDPVALFGSLNFTVARAVDNLNQYNTVDRSTLTAVRPGKSIGFGAGFTYALSYNVSTSVSFQETVTTNSHITYIASGETAPTTAATTMQVAAILNFGLGVRLSPKTTVNLTAGIGMTTDSPDFNLGLNVPLTFSMF
jgi:hypothetical protein